MIEQLSVLGYLFDSLRIFRLSKVLYHEKMTIVFIKNHNNASVMRWVSIFLLTEALKHHILVLPK